MEEGRNAFKILTDKPTGKGYLGKPRRICWDNIRMGVKEIHINMSDGLFRLGIEPL